MSTETPNIKLKKLESTDLVARTLFNVNADILDLEINNLKTSNRDTQDTITQIGMKQTELENSQTGLETRTAANEQAIVELQGDVEDVQQSIQDFATKEEVQEVADAVSVIEDHLATIDTALSDQATKNTAFTQKDQQLQTDIATLQTAVEAIDITALQAAIDDKTDKSYVDDGFYSKQQADQRFLSKAAYKDQRTVVFIGPGIETRYPWSGTVQHIQINCPLAKETDVLFKIERQAKADYEAKLANWQMIGGQTLNFQAGKVYMEYTIATDGSILADDILRLFTENDDGDLTAQAFIQNN